MLALLAVSTAQATVTLDISPKGTMPDDRSVKVVVTARFEPGATIEDFSISYNGADVTQVFVENAQITRLGSTTLVATLDYLFPPGSHAVSARLKMSGDVGTTANTLFEVPESEQIRLRNSLLSSLNTSLRQYDAYRFSRVMSMGDIAKFTARASDPSFQVYMNPELLASKNAVAAYYELYVYGLWPTSYYYRDLVLRYDPALFVVGASTEFSPMILWHEMVHALSHLASETNSLGRLPDPQSGTSLEAIDHFYTDWAEACMSDGLLRLKNFEDHIVKQGSGAPTAAAVATARAYWRAVVNGCNSSNNPLGVPATAQRAVFKALVGFDVDVNKIRLHYLSLGYPKEYFDAATVSIMSPGVSSTVTTADVEVSAMVSLTPGTRIDLAGFLINETIVRYATLNNDTFFDRVPLNIGPNTIQAGVIPRAAAGNVEDAVLSKPITVTRQVPTPVCPQITTWTNTDQNLYAPLRVTRVDRSNSPGYFYFYTYYRPNDPQERGIANTFFSLRATPSLTRDQIFANNVGVSLISFNSGTDASAVWQRELAAWDAQLPANRPDLLLREPNKLVWGWTAIDGSKTIASLALYRGSVIVSLGASSSAAGETLAAAGMAALTQRESTTLGLIDVKCSGR